MPPSPILLERMRKAATLLPEQFVADYILGGQAFACGEDLESHLELRREVGDILGVGAANTTLIGSAKVGFSLNADHLLSIFGRQSDLDFVVVDPAIFDATTLELVTRTEDFVLAGEDEKRRLRRSREHVADGFLRPDHLPLGCWLSKEWFPRLAGPYTHPLLQTHPVKAWVFKSLEFASIVYRSHVRRVQPAVHRILTGRGDL
jgi:hypothetical protein